MNNISVAELYELYLDTVRRCTSCIRDRTDEELQYDIFEEFDIGAHSLLHEDNLSRLRHAGYLDDEMVKLSRDVRKRWLEFQDRSWAVEDVRTRREWQELFHLCDTILSKSSQHQAVER